MPHPTSKRDDTVRRRRGAGRVGAIALALALTTGLAAAPVGARTPSMPTRAGDLRGQAPTGAPLDDTPLATNPVSSALAAVDLDSAELGDRGEELDAAEARRDEARRTRDGHRAHIQELATERAATVVLVEQLRWIELQAGVTREAAVAAHRARAAEAEAASARLGREREQLRDLMVDAYTSGSSELADALTLASGVGRANDSLVRRHLETSSIEAHVARVEVRLRTWETAVTQRERALAVRRHTEDAEQTAIGLRRAAEDRVVAIDAETVATEAAEVEAGRLLTQREGQVLVAIARMGPARLRADVQGDGLDFQLVALDAWVKAAASAPCKVEWWALAGISKIESRHGTYRGGRLDARGRPSVQIIGPRLDGAGAFARIPDTDGGLHDGDTAFDRAVGPMQFIPSTWARWGRDGDGDGARDPHTIYDAAAAAAAYLCYGRSDLTQDAQLRSAYLSYNQSSAYVEAVLRAARGYQRALLVGPHEPPPTEGG